MSQLSTGTAARINTFGSLFPPAAALISAPILARGLGVEGRGDLAAATSALALAMSALTLGIPEAMTFLSGRSGVYDRRLARIGLASLFVVGLVASTFMALSAGALTADEHLQSLIVMSSACIPLALALGAVRGTAAGLGLWRRIGLERISSSLVRLIVLAGLFITDLLTTTTATVTVSVTMFGGVLCYARAFRTHRGEALPQSTSYLGPLFSFSLRVWPGTLAGSLILRLDQFLMLPLSSSRQLGLYVVAVSFAEVALVFNNAIRDVLFAVESRQPNPARLAQAARISTLITAGTSLGLGLSAAFLVPVLFGVEFAGAVPAIVVLLAGIVIGNPGSLAGAGLAGWGRPGLRSAALLVACALNVMAILVLVPHYGATGAAAATAIANLAAGILGVMFASRILKLPIRDFYSIRVTDVSLLAHSVRLRRPR